MEISVNQDLVQNLYNNLGKKILKAGNLPAQIKTDVELAEANAECRRFLLNYQFQMWENLTIVYLMYQVGQISQLFFEDLEDTYYKFIHDSLPDLILKNYLIPKLRR